MEPGAQGRSLYKAHSAGAFPGKKFRLGGTFICKGRTMHWLRKVMGTYRSGYIELV